MTQQFLVTQKGRKVGYKLVTGQIIYLFTRILSEKRPKDHILGGCVVIAFLCGTGKISIMGLRLLMQMYAVNGHHNSCEGL